MVIALRLDNGNNYGEEDTALKKLQAINKIDKEIIFLKDMIKMNVFMALEKRKRQEDDKIREEEITRSQLIVVEEKKAEVKE